MLILIVLLVAEPSVLLHFKDVLKLSGRVSYRGGEDALGFPLSQSQIKSYLDTACTTLKHY